LRQHAERLVADRRDRAAVGDRDNAARAATSPEPPTDTLAVSREPDELSAEPPAPPPPPTLWANSAYDPTPAVTIAPVLETVTWSPAPPAPPVPPTETLTGRQLLQPVLPACAVAVALPPLPPPPPTLCAKRP
jgi:hypothetical protein